MQNGMKNGLKLGFLVLLLAPGVMLGMQRVGGNSTLGVRRAAAHTAQATRHHAGRVPKAMPTAGVKARAAGAQTAQAARTGGRLAARRMPKKGYKFPKTGAFAAGIAGVAAVAGLEKYKQQYARIPLEAKWWPAFVESLIEDINRDPLLSKEGKQEFYTAMLKDVIARKASFSFALFDRLLELGADPFASKQEDGRDAVFVQLADDRFYSSGSGEWLVAKIMEGCDLKKADPKIISAFISEAVQSENLFAESPWLYREPDPSWTKLRTFGFKFDSTQGKTKKLLETVISYNPWLVRDANVTVKQLFYNDEGAPSYKVIPASEILRSVEEDYLARLRGGEKAALLVQSKYEDLLAKKFGYALKKRVDKKLLDRDYRRLAEFTEQGLLHSINEDGMPGNVEKEMNQADKDFLSEIDPAKQSDFRKECYIKNYFERQAKLKREAYDTYTAQLDPEIKKEIEAAFVETEKRMIRT